MTKKDDMNGPCKKDKQQHTVLKPLEGMAHALKDVGRRCQAQAEGSLHMDLNHDGVVGKAPGPHINGSLKKDKQQHAVLKCAEKVVYGLGDVGRSWRIKAEDSLHVDLNGDGSVGKSEDDMDASCHSLLNRSDSMLNGPELFNAIDYEEARHDMGTGDLILLHGTQWYSLIIKGLTGGWYTHVGVVVRDPPHDILQLYKVHPDKDGLYVLESSPHTDDGRTGGGVQLSPLGQWLQKKKKFYAIERGDTFFVSWRRLHFENYEKSEKRPTKHFPSFVDFLKDAHEKSYERDSIELFQCARKANKKEDLSSIFCSELVAWAFEALNLLPQRENASNWVPSQFSFLHKSDWINKKIARGGHLDKDRRIQISEQWSEVRHPKKQFLCPRLRTPPTQTHRLSLPARLDPDPLRSWSTPQPSSPKTCSSSWPQPGPSTQPDAVSPGRCPSAMDEGSELCREPSAKCFAGAPARPGTPERRHSTSGVFSHSFKFPAIQRGNVQR